MRFLFPILLLFPILASSQGNAPFFHIQSVAVPRADILNDSVLLCYPNIDLQDMNSADIVHFNINTRTWTREGKVPALGNAAFTRFERGSDSVFVVTTNGQVHYAPSSGQPIVQATIPFSTTQTQTFNAFNKVFNGYLMQFQLSSMWHFYHSYNGVDWVHAGGIPVNNSIQRLSIVGDTIYYTGIGTEIMLNANGGRNFGSSTGTGRFVPQNTNNFQAVSHTVFFAWSSAESHRSGNAGQTWSPLVVPGSPFASGLLRIAFKNQAEGVFTFQPQGGFYTLDSGVTLVSIPPSPSGGVPTFRYMGNRLLTGTGLYMDYTSDYGQTWESLQAFNIDDVFDIHFKGPLGMLVGEDGKYMLSTNGGHWFDRGVAPATSTNNTACHIINDTSIVLGNFGGSIFRSTDLGANWVSGGGGGNNHVHRFKSNAQGELLTRRGQNGMFSNDFGRTNSNFGLSQNVTNIFDVLPGGGEMRFARDHGTEFRVSSVTFPMQTSNSPVQLNSFPRTNEELVDFEMATDQIGYILMRSPNEQFITFKTTDGGNSWVRQAGFSAPVTLAGAGLKFQALAPEVLAVAQYPWNLNIADYNRLFFSTNGGQSWQEYVLPVPAGISNFNIRSAHFFSTDLWWVGMRNNRLVINGFAPSGSAPTAIEEKSVQPLKLSIYPNPAQDQLTIELPEKPCSVIITDLQGRVVQTEATEGGLQRLALQLPAGLYMVRAVAEDGKYQSYAKLLVQ